MFAIYEFHDEKDGDTDWVVVNKKNPYTPSFVLSFQRPNRDAPNFDDHFIKL
jgi:hypothetical protein